MIPYQKILEVVIEKTGISVEEFEQRVKQKREFLQGLVSKEGAAYIVANGELFVDVKKSTTGKMKIGAVTQEMRNLVIVGKVLNIFEIREFERKRRGSNGKVGSLLIGDETGTIRAVFWDEQTEKLKQVKQNDIIKINSAYTKEGSENVELHVNNKTEITINPPGITVETRNSYDVERTTLSNLSLERNIVEILGVIIDVDKPRFYEICVQCGKTGRTHNDEFVCEQHGTTKKKEGYVINIMIDDGTGVVRVACFIEQAQQLLKKTEQDILTIKLDGALFESMRQEAIGKIMKIQGKVKKNNLYDRFELITRDIKEANPQEELEKIA